ncbi:hypothetical protein L6Q21_01325 [Sandaracinobacter sp. RS1-74]|uniref:2'-5' RNA ligase family protein n=1 Tax=Sandaracinobacteroides sayramensis TaxID=2913411 RepID=UPI001EDA5E8A|nr:2'-5' RNA ligase family protein [Sandaracinobacteroides sayramensis]MCG2839619.1 hypothetical protein [Sandaracinobacteroides sayramensis]
MQVESRWSGHNLYLAAIPPPEVAKRLFTAWLALGGDGRFRWQKLHLSILGLACARHVDARLVAEVKETVGGLHLRPFEVRFDRFLPFGWGPDPRPLVFAGGTRNDRPDRLAGQLHEAIAGRRPDIGRRRRVVPHVTASYGAAFPGERPLPEPVCWQVTELVLVDNWIGVPRYDHLARWPLRAGAVRPRAPATQPAALQLELPGLMRKPPPCAKIRVPRIDRRDGIWDGNGWI